jgi:hypothetical protein
MPLSNKLINITESDQQRFYNGHPSVTTVVEIINEPWLNKWRGKVGNEEADRIAKEAAWLGTLVHDTLSALEILPDNPLQSSIDINNLDPLTQHAITLYLQWKWSVLDQWLMIEEPLVDEGIGTGGTPDRVGVLKGDTCLSLIDFKTGNKSIKHRYQTAGYKLLLNRKGIDVKRRIVLYIPTTIKKGQSLSTKEYCNHPRDERGFLSLLEIYNQIQQPD